MKTTTFFALLFSSLILTVFTACTPGDPKVLSDSDRGARSFGGSQKGGGGGSSVQVPEKVEIPLALLIEARHDQGVQVLRKSLELAQSQPESQTEGCLTVQRKEKSATQLKYQVQFLKCQFSEDGATFVYTGAADLELTLKGAQEIQTISYANAKTEDGKVVPIVYVLDSESAARVEDNFDLQIEQTSAGVFDLKKFEAGTMIALGEETFYGLPLSTASGTYTLSAQGEIQTAFVSTIKAQAGNSAGANIQFSLALEKKTGAPGYSFTKVFASGRPTTGQLNPTEDSITLVPFRGKTTTMPRQRIGEKLNGLLPLKLWVAK